MKSFQYMFIATLITSTAMNATKRQFERQNSMYHNSAKNQCKKGGADFAHQLVDREELEMSVANALALKQTQENQPLVTVQDLPAAQVIPMTSSVKEYFPKNLIGTKKSKESVLAPLTKTIAMHDHFDNVKKEIIDAVAMKHLAKLAEEYEQTLGQEKNGSPIMPTQQESKLQSPRLGHFFPAGSLKTITSFSSANSSLPTHSKGSSVTNTRSNE